MTVPPSTTGTLLIEGDARLTLIGYDRDAGVDRRRSLRVRVWVSDRLGWLIATPEQELRFVSIDATIPLSDDAPPATAVVTLHDARVLGQSWERLVVGAAGPAMPLLPEARLLIATAVQRLVADAAANPLAAGTGRPGARRSAWCVNGGAVHDAFDQLVHDASGPRRQRARHRARRRARLPSPTCSGRWPRTIDLDDGTVRLVGGRRSPGLFGWTADVTSHRRHRAAITARSRSVRTPPVGAVGGAQVVIGLSPFTAEFRWHQPGGTHRRRLALWPAPERRRNRRRCSSRPRRAWPARSRSS